MGRTSRPAAAAVLAGSLLAGGLLAGGLLAPTRASAQTVAGLVAEQVTLTPSRGALVTLLRVSGPDGALEPAAVTTADGEGAFLIQAPGPGAYRVQAEVEGLTSPLSPVLELAGGTEVDDLALLVPSRLLLMAYGCVAEAPEGSSVVVGLVRDPVSQVVLPDAKVTAQWRDGSSLLWADAVSDASGRYRICGMKPSSGSIRIRGELVGRQGPWEELPVGGPAILFHDVAVEFRTRTPTGAQAVIQEQVLLETAARSLGDLHGQLLDQLSGTPVPWAVVRLEGTSHQALADGEGRFAFRGLQPGAYELEIMNLGYTVHSDRLHVPPGQDLFVTLRVAPQVVELAGLEVTGRSEVEEARRITPFRRDMVYGSAMLEEEIRGARAFEILRRTVPGIQIREVTREGDVPYVCIETNRRIQRFVGTGECASVQVVVDGIRIPDGPVFMRNMTASDIESMEFLPPSQAQTQYGIGGNTSNGVVVVFTRGRGPYASPLRNRR